MASQAYIIQHESEIIGTETMLESLRDAYIAECSRNLGPVFSDSRVEPDKANRDCWGTLRLNALSMRRALDRLLDTMDKNFA